MSRVINPETARKERIQLQRAILIAIRELIGQPEVNDITYDIAAFLVLSLDEISETVDASVAPWEKRGYWLKSDRFRQEWSWADRLGKQLKVAIKSENWADIALIASKIASKLNNTRVPVRHKLGTPWVGAWGKLSKLNDNNH